MFLNNRFGKQLDILHRTMDVNMFRRSVIADNIANADTPNFKRSTVNFESQLKRALDSERVTKMPGTLTNERHIPFYRPMNYRDVGPRRILDYMTTSDNNGNNVDAETEAILAMQNQLNYELLTRVVSNQFAQINLVLR